MSDLQKLREPFPDSAVGKLPKLNCGKCSKNVDKVCDKHSKSRCRECGNWISTAHIHLDYVGHAGVTDRLLSVDPSWSWEPVAFDADGSPLVKRGAGGEQILWIRLTVCGITRYGVGSCQANSFDAEKQLIGDALRNAAMRFGVALELWEKAELESHLSADSPSAEPAAAHAGGGSRADQEPPSPDSSPPAETSSGSERDQDEADPRVSDTSSSQETAAASGGATKQRREGAETEDNSTPEDGGGSQPPAALDSPENLLENDALRKTHARAKTLIESLKGQKETKPYLTYRREHSLPLSVEDMDLDSVQALVAFLEDVKSGVGV